MWQVTGLSIVLMLSLDARANPTITADHLTVNGRTNPLGISANSVSMSWSIQASERATVQSGYQIRVGTMLGQADVWDSGRTITDKQVDIVVPPSVFFLAATRYFWQVRVWNGHRRASSWSAGAWFETGLLTPSDWQGARWISARKESFGTRAPSQTEREGSLPLLRTVIVASHRIKQARLYVSAHGLYQVRINGRIVGDQFLSPGWTDYNKRVQAQTFDVGDFLSEGKNALGVSLGDGWYKGKVGLGWHDVYGRTLEFVSKLKVIYQDGTSQEFVSDATWLTASGPFVRADLQDGESYDARLVESGWDMPDFDSSRWSHAIVASEDVTKLIPQPDEPVRNTQLLPARALISPAPGRYVFDLGQNMVGVARVRLTGTVGQTVTIRYAEELYRTGNQRGELYTANFRTAKVTDSYTFARNETITYQPCFTQHGFRYVEISGVGPKPALSDVQGVVLGSDLKATGELVLSNAMLSKLIENIRWGERSNFVSIPTDTPARDERLGWTGDINVFAPTANRYADTRAFLSKWMEDMRDAQKADGNLPAVVPQPGRQFDSTGVGWSDAMITVPYAVWRSSGDSRIVRENWKAMLKFYNFVHDSATKDGNLIEEGRSSWFSGDWLGLEKVDRLAEHRLIATAYFAEDTRMMAEMAEVMGEDLQAQRWREVDGKIRKAFAETFRTQDGSIYTGTQTAYAMTLGMGVLMNPIDWQSTAAKFVEKLASDSYHLKTGFLGTPWLLPALSSIGRDDIAMQVLLNNDYPSWGFEISMGATTMWERWNSIRADGQFGDVSMNSFNHYAYGAVADWMFQHLGGLQALSAGYKSVRIAPLFNANGVSWGRCSQQTPYGELSADWSLRGERIVLDVKVPANTSAEVLIPASTQTQVSEGGKAIDRVAGVKSIALRQGFMHVFVGSGEYHFSR